MVLQGQIRVPDPAAEEGGILHQGLCKTVMAAPEDLTVGGLGYSPAGVALGVNEGAVVEAIHQQHRFPQERSGKDGIHLVFAVYLTEGDAAVNQLLHILGFLRPLGPRPQKEGTDPLDHAVVAVAVDHIEPSPTAAQLQIPEDHIVAAAHPQQGVQKRLIVAKIVGKLIHMPSSLACFPLVCPRLLGSILMKMDHSSPAAACFFSGGGYNKKRICSGRRRQMETKKWEALVTAAELGSFTRAAEKLGCTQSGLTHMMNSLESEVGFPLLIRDRYGVRFTPAGERILPAVRELLQAGKRLEGEIAAQSSRKRENIRVAAYSSICMHWLPTIVQQFRWDFPDVSVDIRMGSVEEMYRWLQDDKVDLSFASRQDRGRYDWVPLWDDPLLAILPMDYPAEGLSRFPVAEFDGKEFLMPSLGFDMDILRVFEDRDVRPDIKDTQVEDAAILSMVEHGLGVSILSELVLQGRRDNVRCLPLDPPACRRIGIAAQSLEEASPIVRQFIDYSTRIVAELHQP